MMSIFNKQAPMLSPQLPSGRGDMMPTNRPNMDLDALMAICGPGMQGPAGGNGRVGYRTANGDTGLQGANMPQPLAPIPLLQAPQPIPQQPIQGGPMQMPSAPFQSGMRAGSVGNQMGGLNNMYSNFAAPSPMPAPPPPMFGAPAGNSRAMMGPKPVGLF